MNIRAITKLTKAEIIYLATHRCKHKIPYLQHPNCFRLEHPEHSLNAEKIGFLDIEGSSLVADFGYCFSYAIKELDGKIIGRVLTSEEIQNYHFDRVLMKEFCEDIKKFDRVVVHYGTDRRHDLPFLRTRCLFHKLPFPLYGELFVEDTFPMSRNKLKLRGNRLEKICAFLDIPAKGHKLSPPIWQKALAGHPGALEYIWKHNMEDVVSLEAVWKRLHQFFRRVKSSV